MFTRAKGFSLVELLIALAITAVLLVAMAAAFQASVVNFRQNEEIYRTVNTARAAVVRITRDIRTAAAVSVSEPNEQCSMITQEGADITYRYNSSDNKLYLVTNDNLGDDDYVLCDSVTAMSFGKDTATDDEGAEFVRNVQISITVANGGNSRTVSAAAAVRRNF